jgi:flagellar hook-associated protein 3 FlgL
MRISTSNLFDTGIGRITDLQSSMLKTQQQLSTGLRVLTPADDPVAASRALDFTQSQAVNSQLATNRQNAADSLNLVDSTLNSVTQVLQDAKDAVIQAGNGSLSDADRATIANNLSSQLQELVGLANSKDGTGQYLFSGYSTTTQPFTQTATGATYSGDQGQRMLQVGTQRQLAVSENGQNLFQTGTAQDVFKNLTDAINLLKTPGTANLDAGLANTNNNIEAALNNVLTARTKVGANLKEIDSLNSLGDDLNVQYQQSLSSLQDVDYAKAISDLTQQQTTLQAAQQSFIKITGLSLFSFLS